MENTERKDPQTIQIQGLLDKYLSSRGASPGDSAHLDDDTVSAFIDGMLSERESGPALIHLADCSFCRHKTAELVRLDAAFADEPVTAEAASKEPTRVSEVLGSLLERLFGSSDSSVFAHGEDEKDKKSEDEDETSDGDKPKET